MNKNPPTLYGSLEEALVSEHLLYNLDKNAIQQIPKSKDYLKKLIIADFFDGISGHITQHGWPLNNSTQINADLFAVYCGQFIKQNEKGEKTSIGTPGYSGQELRDKLLGAVLEQLVDDGYLKALLPYMANVADLKALIVIDSLSAKPDLSNIEFEGVEKTLVNFLKRELTENDIWRGAQKLMNAGLKTQADGFLLASCSRPEHRDNPSLMHQLAKLYRQLGLSDQAIDVYNRTLSLSYSDGLQREIDEFKIELAYKENELATAAALNEVMLKADPTDRLAWQTKMDHVVNYSTNRQFIKRWKAKSILKQAKKHGVYLTNPMEPGLFGKVWERISGG